MSLGAWQREVILRNADKDPRYAPYCMRCPGLVRMQVVERYCWRCSCGALCDLRVCCSVWIKGDLETTSRRYVAASPRVAAELAAREDWSTGKKGWPVTYCAREDSTGVLWTVEVDVLMQPALVVTEVSEVAMPAALHVLWGGRVLCEDRRLRGVPGSWPAGQRWISLRDVADGAAEPGDRCEKCWRAAPGLVDGLRQICAGADDLLGAR